MKSHKNFFVNQILFYRFQQEPISVCLGRSSNSYARLKKRRGHVLMAASNPTILISFKNFTICTIRIITKCILTGGFGKLSKTLRRSLKTRKTSNFLTSSKSLKRTKMTFQHSSKRSPSAVPIAGPTKSLTMYLSLHNVIFSLISCEM